MKRLVGLGSGDGVDKPREAATRFDVVAILTFIAALLAAWGLAAGGEVSAAIGVVIGAVLSAIFTHGLAVGMRWLAAMYELAARGFEPEQPAEKAAQRAHEHRRLRSERGARLAR